MMITTPIYIEFTQQQQKQQLLLIQLVGRLDELTESKKLPLQGKRVVTILRRAYILNSFKGLYIYIYIYILYAHTMLKSLRLSFDYMKVSPGYVLILLFILQIILINTQKGLLEQLILPKQFATAIYYMQINICIHRLFQSQYNIINQHQYIMLHIATILYILQKQIPSKLQILQQYEYYRFQNDKRTVKKYLILVRRYYRQEQDNNIGILQKIFKSTAYNQWSVFIFTQSFAQLNYQQNIQTQTKNCFVQDIFHNSQEKEKISIFGS
eukprot:TRINITY_DN7745_c0_g2_i1.p3 TRINITY_DN7745_c0_g2~~TRINITY_DN7745_c0_g2_i1.p3  ORF type:complete len:268 (-),score=-3.62 TRINITY_DN7745_c0_g2_i1:2036-2839(-)